MDLKDVIAKVKNAAESAHSSFHAGRRDDATNYLADIRAVIEAFCEQPETKAGDVTESATTEKPDEVPKEKLAEAPGAVLPASQFDRAAAARQVGTGAVEPKPPR